MIALARLGQGDEAMELFHMINPINHMRTRGNVDRYRAEPYVMAADVYAHPMHIGRAGWTWYTGPAGWMYQAAIQELLGIRRNGSTIGVNPCIPAGWQGYSVDWTIGRSRYHFTVANPQHRCCGVSSVALDGRPVDPRAIPLEDDGREHEITIELGTPSVVEHVNRAAH